MSEWDRTVTKRTNSTVAAASLESDRDLIARQVARIVLRLRAVEIAMSDKRYDRGDASRAATGVEWRSPDADQRAARSDRAATETERHRTDGEPSIRSADAQRSIRSISIPCTPSAARRRKGVVHRPASLNLDPRDRDALLTAIAKARSWVDDLIEQRVQSFEDIAEREQNVARHIRFLAALAFLVPRVVAAIANGDVPAGITVSGLVRSLPFNWREQEQRFGLR